MAQRHDGVGQADWEECERSDSTSALCSMCRAPLVAARAAAPLLTVRCHRRSPLAARRWPLAVPAFSSPFLVTSHHQPPPPFLATTSSPSPSPRQSLLITRKPYPATPNDSSEDDEDDEMDSLPLSQRTKNMVCAHATAP